MSIEFLVLGEPGHDNALFVKVSTGQSIHRLLFDCGENVPDAIPASDKRALDHLFFSHFHMDHVAGFDPLFRMIYDRIEKPNMVWGPPEAMTVMPARLRGFTWNLHAGDPGSWIVHAIGEKAVLRTQFNLGEEFGRPHPLPDLAFDGTLIDTDAYRVRAIRQDHLTPSLVYRVDEKARINIDTEAMKRLGVEPGPWLRDLKLRPPGDEGTIMVNGVERPVPDLLAAIAVRTEGSSIAYCTDFRLDDAARPHLVEFLRGSSVIVCESTYAQNDAGLAYRNYHLSDLQAAELARDAHAGQLVLMHVSDRYRAAEWAQMLEEARAVFAQTFFPEQWGIFQQ